MYVILEMQTNGSTTALTTPVTKETLNEAEAVFHQILMYAATSNVEKHTAMVVDEQGVVFDSKCYYHGAAAQ